MEEVRCVFWSLELLHLRDTSANLNLRLTTFIAVTNLVEATQLSTRIFKIFAIIQIYFIILQFKWMSLIPKNFFLPHLELFY